MRCVSAQLGDYPSRSVGTSGNPGIFRTTVQAMASTAMTAIAGGRQDGRPGAIATGPRPASIGQADEKEDVVDDGGAKISVQQVVGHPEAAAHGTVPAREELEGQAGKTKSGCADPPDPRRRDRRPTARPCRVRRIAVSGCCSRR